MICVFYCLLISILIVVLILFISLVFRTKLDLGIVKKSKIVDEVRTFR